MNFPKIEFVNHASLIVSNDDVQLIMDPWLDGDAFNGGWRHISETKLKYSEFKKITHIWFSHEHPDHFSPKNIFCIPPEVRKGITVLFQETVDKKVSKFCLKAGFKKVIELSQDNPFEVGDDFSIMCNPYVGDDSYAYLHVNGYGILNLNDCVVDSRKKALEIKRRCGKVDVLLTQFGYADKVGNREDIILREEASSEKVRRIVDQNSVFKPNFIIPFASYIYFCHSENAYMNEGFFSIDRVFAELSKCYVDNLVIMYPGDNWIVGQEWNDNSVSITKYIKDLAESLDKELNYSINIPLEDLIAESTKYASKLKDYYGVSYFSKLSEVNLAIVLTDLNVKVTLNGLRGLLQLTDNSVSTFDVQMSSESLYFALKNLFGFDTLDVNARYQTLSPSGKQRFDLIRGVSAAANRCEQWPIPSYFMRIKRRLLFELNHYRGLILEKMDN